MKRRSYWQAKAKQHKKRAARFKGFEVFNDVARAQRAGRATTAPRISAAWMRSVSAMTQNFL